MWPPPGQPSGPSTRSAGPAPPVRRKSEPARRMPAALLSARKVTSGLGFPGPCAWEHQQSGGGHPSRPRPRPQPRHRHAPAILPRPWSSDVRLCLESPVCTSMRTGAPSFLCSAPPAWPLVCGLTEAPGCAVFSWLPVAPLRAGHTQDDVEGNGIVHRVPKFCPWDSVGGLDSFLLLDSGSAGL